MRAFLGEIVELPPPGPQHGRFQAQLIALLSNAVSENASLWVTGDTAIWFDDDTVCACDVAIVQGSDAARSLRPEQIIVAVEVSISTIRYDITAKAESYARAGVAVLWVADPQAAVVHVFEQPDEGFYKERSIVRFNEPLAVPGTDQSITID
jgi:Uma2 family endonuclease